MSNSDRITMFLKVYLVGGAERTHSIELDARGGQQIINFTNKLSDGVKNMLDKGNVLILPGPPTIYKSDKVMWVEIGFIDRQDLTNILEQQARRRIGFRTP